MLHFYHPSKNNNGFAASFWISDRDDAIFATILKQSGWDPNTQNGTFKASMNDPKKKTNIKFGYTEACGILDCIERNRPFSNFHDNDDSSKSIKFEPWLDKTSGAVRGYSFSVLVKDKQDPSTPNSFLLGLTFAEARHIREFIIFALHKSFTAKSTFKDTSPAKASYPKAEDSQPEPQPANDTSSHEPQQAPQEIKRVDPLADF